MIDTIRLRIDLTVNEERAETCAAAESFRDQAFLLQWASASVGAEELTRLLTEAAWTAVRDELLRIAMDAKGGGGS